MLKQYYTFSVLAEISEGKAEITFLRETKAADVVNAFLCAEANIPLQDMASSDLKHGGVLYSTFVVPEAAMQWIETMLQFYEFTKGELTLADFE